MLKLILTLFGIEYFIASNITNLVIEKTGLAIPEDLKLAVTDRVHRLRFELRLLFRLLVFITGFYAFPMQMRIWDLEWQLLIERFLNPIFEVLAFCQGLVTGILIGVLVTVTLFWLEKNKTMLLNLYLLHIHGVR
jgi:hypothetical protein